VLGGLLGLCLLSPIRPLAAQQDALNRATTLERRGDPTAALALYQAVLQDQPAEINALLGAERCLGALNRSLELIPAVQAAVAANPTSSVIYALAIRTWGAAEQPDSIRRYAERWAQLSPGDESPYREWGAALQGMRDLAGARQAYLSGRQRLGAPDALSPELAQLAVRGNDYPTALQEWLKAMTRLPGYRPTAVRALSQAPDAVRPGLLRSLDQDHSAMARGLSIDLRARWGDPVGAFHVLSAALPPDSAEAADMLRNFLVTVRGITGPEARSAQAMTLESLAERRTGIDRARLHLEAAQVYAEAGDRKAARRMLTRLSEDPDAAALQVGSTTTLVALLIADGAMDEAAQRLEQVRGALTADDYQRLRRDLAVGWIRAGALDQAQALVQSDSSIDGLALAGRLRLYRGDLAGARTLLKEAGPYAGSRAEATDRSALLALIQVVNGDSLPALGTALLALARHDSTGAVKGLERIAADQPPPGAAALRVLAGRVEAARGHGAEAERLFRAARVPEAPASAAEAELELGRLMIALNRLPEATEPLEHLILTYPESALVPEARRLLNVARGLVPRT
jgi:tetratricopeptide (TPR) repeat protein